MEYECHFLIRKFCVNTNFVFPVIITTKTRTHIHILISRTSYCLVFSKGRGAKYKPQSRERNIVVQGTRRKRAKCI